MVRARPNSGVLVLPKITSPASLKRRTMVESAVATALAFKAEPALVTGQLYTQILEQERHTRKGLGQRIVRGGQGLLDMVLGTTGG